MPLTVSPLYVKSHHIANYCYLIVNEENHEAVLIDPAWDLSKIRRQLKQSGANLSAILLTHSHYDHTNLVEKLVKLYNPDVYMSQRETAYYKFQCPNLIELEDGQELDLHGINVKCTLTPGHTAGSMCFGIENRLFTGDTVFIEGCGICADDGADAGELYESLSRLRDSFPPKTIIYPGHSFGEKPGVPFESVLKINIYFQIDDKEQFITFRTRGNQKGLFQFK